jgi:hypothetical protein
MHLETYDYLTGKPIETIQDLDFGALIQTQHSTRPILFKAVSDGEPNVNGLKLYLESKETWKDTQFGYYTDSTFIPALEAGNARYSHFVETNDATYGFYDTSSNGVSVGWDQTSSDYVWLDAHVFYWTGTNQVNFRLFFDHS